MGRHGLTSLRDTCQWKGRVVGGFNNGQPNLMIPKIQGELPKVWGKNMKLS
jgi:hypothetical protein